jgi:hypothetical protein
MGNFVLVLTATIYGRVQLFLRQVSVVCLIAYSTTNHERDIKRI